ncbi:carbohydrate binding family 9 domain-containing protein [Pontibacter sp. E15-1]|uniref:DUF5916 domain-containing protein n=1 Tax=Pontibacter sp. E15-1 TaxID=2919918 RepID=UPI001F500DA8|nr:DUF5916 domain-containing protein [Pontibacter sp. E15-1]MCJ8165414.1 carbohydrate binding family 9 domain-containing protein [Pontibacter sp. E15-1]
MNLPITALFKTTLLLTLITLLSHVAQGQDKQTKFPQRSLQALRITEAPRIDGVLDEPIWQQAEIATQFIQNRPNPGVVERLPTEVRIVYDDVAIYVGAVMHDVSQDSIFRELGRRDDLGNTDWFGVFFDTYKDQINGFGFFVTPAGVQLDARYSSNGEDFSWNAVWESSAKLEGTDWVAELKIPYSAIRFSSKQEQVWGLNLMRNRQSTRERFFWNHLEPGKDGFVNQWGLLQGLKDIEAPLRLSLTPYLSGYMERFPVDGQGKVEDTHYKNDMNVSGGLDLKYGINDAFTLDMTLIPDFSQVQSDNRVLNLSPFEQQFSENRPFFLEGTELFNKGNFFYSRRIGGTPTHYGTVYDKKKYKGYEVLQNPRETKMINGTKVSGRTQSGLGVGIFNAVVGRQHAVLQDSVGDRLEVETQPLTNYNIAVFDQSLKNNSYVTLVNTNVMRQGGTYDANLTGALFRFANKENKYAVNGKAALSQRYHTDSTNLGYMYELGFGKISGNVQYNLSHSVKSDTYDPNDLGILFVNNSIEEEANISYNKYEPFWKMQSLYTTLGAVYSRRYDPNVFQNFVMYANANGTFKNFMSAGLSMNLEPVKTFDFFEPRAAGRYYVFPVNYSVNGWLSTDYRKRLAMEVGVFYRMFEENARRSLSVFLEPRFRVNNQLSFSYAFESGNRYDDIGFFANSETVNETGGTDKKIIFGLRDVNSVYNRLSGSYIFNNRMSLALRVRHNWSKVMAREFFALEPNGNLRSEAYDPETPNQNYNSFNLDMVYSWWFAPGSEISIVWKNAFEENVDTLEPRYFDNFSHTLTSPQSSTFSIKVLYYLDYLTMRSKLSKGRS